MPKIVKSEKRIKKEKYWARLQYTAQHYKNAAFIDANNVSSKQICMIRQKLRQIDAVMIMGKNTLMKASLTQINASEDKDFVRNENIDKIIS